MSWYAAQCNEDWEHSFGVKIDTLDNPGWSVEIDLEDTGLCNKPFKEVDIQRNGEDWIYCVVRDDKFKGAGGVLSLEELLLTFLDWAQQ